MTKSNYDGEMNDAQLESVRQDFYAGDVNVREAIIEEMKIKGFVELAEELELYQEESDLNYHEEGNI